METDMLPLFTGDPQPADRPSQRLLPLRERPAYRVTAAPNACSTLELLAALVGGTQPDDKAQALLARFGSLHGLARASLADLTAVPGIGENVAARLMAALEISRRLLAPEEERLTIRSPADAAALLQPLLMHREQEYLYSILLDTRNRVIGEPREVYHGSVNTSLIRVGEVFRDAIKANAAAIIVAHNHPSGQPDPSPEDVACTRSIVEAGKLLDCAVLDHLVLGSGGVRWVSMKERGLGFNR
jgi:DNA repair protein RadC